MAWRQSQMKFLVGCLVCCLLVVVFLATVPLTKLEGSSCSQKPYILNDETVAGDAAGREGSLKTQQMERKLGILVPFRDRFEELLAFAPHMHKFLSVQKVKHSIFVVNQVDRYRFNRASLLNIAFLYARKECDYVAMHDIDLLPINNELSYAYPEDGPLHLASPELHPKYHYPTFVGGILLLKREHFERVNGLSNRYWGWGLEDDEFYVRMKEAGLNISRPYNISTGTHNTFRHIHDRKVRKRDMAKCFNQREVTRKRDRHTGLTTVKYKVHSVNNLTIESVPVTVINVGLICDHSLTPWCDCSDMRDTKDNQQNRKHVHTPLQKKDSHLPHSDIIVPKIHKGDVT